MGIIPVGWPELVAYIVGGIMLVTSITGMCPLYSVLGIDTKGKG